MKSKNRTKNIYKGFEIRVHQVGVYSARKDGVVLNGTSNADVKQQIDAIT